MIKVSFLGDSITDAGGASDRINLGYVNDLARLFPLNAKKYAIGGTRIARDNGCNNEYNFLDRAKEMDLDTDFIFVMGGTNDFGHGFAPIGEKGSKDEYTFIGACDSLMRFLIDKFGRNKLCFIIPLPRKDGDLVDYRESINTEKRKAPFSVYQNIIKELADLYHIKTLDLSDVFNDLDRLTVDGLHPNDLGHEVIAKALKEYLISLGF